MLQELARAKINLTLDILGLRPDGYHELETIMQTIHLHDCLTFQAAEEHIFLSCTHPDVPAEEDNLIYQAAMLLLEYTRLKLGARIKVQKNIPVAAGLAGGSADGAAALKGLNRLWRLGLTDGELISLGARLGADVPFCLFGGTVLARGKGEVLHSLPCLQGVGVILVKPSFSVSTARIYKLYDQLYDQMGGGPRPDNKVMIEALQKKKISKIGSGLGNVLERFVSFLYPEIKEIKKALLVAGALGASMSGSGPTVFGLCENEEQAIKVAGRLKINSEYTVLVTITV